MQIIHWQKHLGIPKEAELSEAAKDLILKLCTSAETRLGNNGAGEIKEHPFFKGFDFTSEIRKTQAPYKPKISHPTDTSNFENYNTMTQFDELDDCYEYQERNLNNYENNDYMANSDDESNLAQKTEGHKRRNKERKLPQHAFFEFTFRRFFHDDVFCISNMNKFNGLDINNLDINLDGTLKLGSLKSNRGLEQSAQSSQKAADASKETKEAKDQEKKNEGNPQVYV